jgi:hypothetical protein
LAIALTELDSERCSGCGQSRLESMDKDSEFLWRAEPIRCHSCATRERAARANNGSEGWDGAGVTWLTRRKSDG